MKRSAGRALTMALLGSLVAGQPVIAKAISRGGFVSRAVVFGKSRAIRITFGNRSELVARGDNPTDTLGTPRIERKGLVAGWSVLGDCSASYQCPVSVDVVRLGKLYTIGCEQGMAFGWRFISTDRIALNCSFPHGTPHAFRQLSTIVTSKVVGHVDLPDGADCPPASAPSWSRGKFDE